MIELVTGRAEQLMIELVTGREGKEAVESLSLSLPQVNGVNAW